MKQQPRLNQRQIDNLKYIAVLGVTGSGASLRRPDRELMLPLWRRGLIEIWYRQSPNGAPALQGPFYRLAEGGRRLHEAIRHGSHKREAVVQV